MLKDNKIHTRILNLKLIQEEKLILDQEFKNLKEKKKVNY